MKKRHTNKGSGQRRRTLKACRRLVRVREADLPRMEDRSDWDRVDALTDQEVHAAISDDPDAAPVLKPLSGATSRSSTPARQEDRHHAHR